MTATLVQARTGGCRVLLNFGNMLGISTLEIIFVCTMLRWMFVIMSRGKINHLLSSPQPSLDRLATLVAPSVPA